LFIFNRCNIVPEIASEISPEIADVSRIAPEIELFNKSLLIAPEVD
jgi:hypothetical protein